MTSPVFTPGTRVRITHREMQGRTGTIRPPAERMYGFELLVRIDRPKGRSLDYFFNADELEPLS